MPFPDLHQDEVREGAPETIGPGHTGVYGTFIFAGPGTPGGMVSSGSVGCTRDLAGSDGDDFGSDWVSHRVPVCDGRVAQPPLRLDGNGVQLVAAPPPPGAGGGEGVLDFLDQDSVVGEYYPHCCALVQAMTGAAEVVAFDHNVRGRALKAADAQIRGGSAVQGPASIVHNDYTLDAAPRRLGQLAAAPSINDTLHAQGQALVSKERMRGAERGGRWCMINVWRNIRPEPVGKTPLAVVDAASVPLDGDSVVTFEIRYSDRVGENYMLKHQPGQRFYYFPKMTREVSISARVPVEVDCHN
jgi:hypothetical protein